MTGQRICSFIVLAVAIVTGITGLLIPDAGWKIGLEITSLLSMTANLTLNITLNMTFSSHVNKTMTKIKQDFDIDIKKYEIQLTEYSAKVAVLNKNIVNVQNNSYYQNISSQKNDINKAAIEALDKIFKPLEDSIAEQFSIENPFEMHMFDDFEKFSRDMANSNYLFSSQILNDKYIDLCSASKKLAISLLVCLTFGPQPGTYISTYTVYDKAFRRKDPRFTQTDVDNAFKSLQEFNKDFYNTISAYRDLKRAWAEL